MRRARRGTGSRRECGAASSTTQPYTPRSAADPRVDRGAQRRQPDPPATTTTSLAAAGRPARWCRTARGRRGPLQAAIRTAPGSRADRADRVHQRPPRRLRYKRSAPRRSPNAYSIVNCPGADRRARLAEQAPAERPRVARLALRLATRYGSGTIGPRPPRSAAPVMAVDVEEPGPGGLQALISDLLEQGQHQRRIRAAVRLALARATAVSSSVARSAARSSPRSANGRAVPATTSPTTSPDPRVCSTT